MRQVLETNEGNELVEGLISQVMSGTYVRPQNTPGIPVVNENTVSQNGDVITTSETPDTDIVTSLNRPGNNNAAESIGTASVPEAEATVSTETIPATE